MPTKKQKAWQFDETIKKAGTDFHNKEEVKVYDKRMSKLRDIEKEAEEIKKDIELKPEHTILEIGCGTGEFAIRAAGVCKKVIATDVSLAMLEYAKEKAEKKGIKNIEWVQAGFLTLGDKIDEPVDAVVSQLALHHLPDFWKMVALQNINNALKPCGVFYLRDVIFHHDLENYEERIDNWICSTKERGGAVFEKNFSVHIKDENSTFDWILEEMMKRTGFTVEKTETKDGFITTYVCKKKR